MLSTFIHELGHFFAAKMMGTWVEEVTLGMGVEVIQFKLFNTPFSFRLIPLGGLTEVNSYNLDCITDRSKILITISGVMFNLLFLFGLLGVFYYDSLSQGLYLVNQAIGVSSWKTYDVFEWFNMPTGLFFINACIMINAVMFMVNLFPF